VLDLLSKQPGTDQALIIFASATLAAAIATDLGRAVVTIITLIVNSPSPS
jgi:hypothetical protein